MLRKPPVGWFARPTVVIDGAGQPAQWGSGTWQLPVDGRMQVGVYLYNRLWRFGSAEVTVEASDPVRLTYRPPIFPFGQGRLTRS